MTPGPGNATALIGCVRPALGPLCQATNLLPAVDDFPTRIADFLESFTSRVRSMTVDRVAGWVRWVAAAPLLLVLGLAGVILLLIGLHRLLGELIGVRWSWIAIGGLFAVVALFLWLKRHPKGQPS